MSPSLGTRALGSPALRHRVAAMVASLPASFHLTDGPADVVALDGDGDWTARAQEALRGGARALVVSDPEPRDTRGLLADAERLGATIALDSPWSRNPAVPAAAAELSRRLSGGGGLLELEVVSGLGAPVLATVAAQLALVRSLSGPVTSAKLVAATARGCTILGSMNPDARVKLVTIQTDARPTSARLRFIGRDGSVDLSIPDPSTSRPAELTLTTRDGSILMPTVFESARRSVWRSLHSAVTADRPLNDLDEFIGDADIVRALADELTAVPDHDFDTDRRRKTR
ncbi:hypothetical protein [Leifsonia sp. NPDC058230]|uniref:hypothetical protein n=1 Tax=Leifsonia sp. NPDC058230 TaxID=3346391 RepID=UPI0036D914E4